VIAAHNCTRAAQACQIETPPSEPDEEWKKKKIFSCHFLFFSYLETAFISVKLYIPPFFLDLDWWEEFKIGV
jgi:hypothetical protein